MSVKDSFISLGEGGDRDGRISVSPGEPHLHSCADGALKSLGVTDALWYPSYHVAPSVGWLGVPGGLCCHDGIYHIFYQHNPYNVTWGTMHWGHLTSRDLVHWAHQPIALTPGDGCDRDGCFSGCAVSHNGSLYIFYTGHTWQGEGEEAAGDSPAFYQQQCLAVSTDGVHFTKRGAVVRPPPGYVHFRDPKVWWQSGRWWMICGAREAAQDIGQLLLFSSDDLEQWDSATWQVLGATEDRNVFMWECPDYFELGEANVLLFSPQGMRPSGYKYRNRFQSGYMFGRWTTTAPPASSAADSPAPSAVACTASSNEGSRNNNACTSSATAPSVGSSGSCGRLLVRSSAEFKITRRFREIDFGHDFYAPQTLLTPDGRRLVIGWLDMWESPMPTRKHGWSGCMTLPRELMYDDVAGRIKMVPPRELLALRRTHTQLAPRRVGDSTTVLLVEECVAHEVELVLSCETSTGEKYGLWLGEGTELYVDTQSNRLLLNRHYPQYMLSGYRSCSIPEGPLLRLRVFIDRSSIEVFVNNGAATFSSRIFPWADDRSLRLFSTNGHMDMVGGSLWDLYTTVPKPMEG